MYQAIEPPTQVKRLSTSLGGRIVMPGYNVTEKSDASARCAAYLTVGCSILASMTVLLMQAIPMIPDTAADVRIANSTRARTSGASVIWGSSPCLTSVESNEVSTCEIPNPDVACLRSLHCTNLYGSFASVLAQSPPIAVGSTLRWRHKFLAQQLAPSYPLVVKICSGTVLQDI